MEPTMPKQNHDQDEREARLDILIDKERKLSLLERAATGRPLTSRFGPIHVHSYVRAINDQSQQVDAHTRSRPGEGKPIDVPLAKDYEKYIGTLVGDGECVDFVKKAVPSLNRQTKTWKKVEQLRGYNDPPLQPGTPIALMDENGYAGHAAIFVTYYVEGKKSGFLALEQWAYRPATETTDEREEQPVRAGGDFTLDGRKTGIYDGRKYWVIK
jgi:hypothetical protein